VRTPPRTCCREKNEPRRNKDSSAWPVINLLTERGVFSHIAVCSTSNAQCVQRAVRPRKFINPEGMNH